MTDANANRGAFHHIDLSVSDVAAARRVYAPMLDFLGYTMVKDRPDGCEWDLKGREPFGASLGIPVGSIGPLRGRCLDRLRGDPAIAALINADGAGVSDPPSARGRASAGYGSKDGSWLR